MLRKKGTGTILLCLMPSLLLLSFMILYPTANIVLGAFYEINYVGGRESFVGLENFRAAFFEEDFLQILKQTGLFTGIVLSLVLVISMGIAV
ncbi:unnamed protein product, partial [marine sediment metagenome]